MFNLSIIIPHYNSPFLLKKLLDTVPPMDDIQVIIIDDKSDTHIKDLKLLIKQYKCRSLLYLENKTEKKGAGVCRNIGIQHARGRWLLFADADDFFVGNFYGLVSKYFDSNNQVVFFNPMSIERDTGNISDRHLPYMKINNNFIKKKDQKSEVFLRYRFFVPWSKLIKRSYVIENNIWFDEVIAANDVMFSTKIGYYMQDFTVSRGVLYCSTRGKGTLTMNMSENTFYSRLMVFVEYYNFLRSKISEVEFELLNISGRKMILKAIKHRLGIKKILDVYSILRKHDVKVFEIQLINPIALTKKLFYIGKRYKKQKRYLCK